MKDRIVIKEDLYVKHFLEREKEFYEEDLCSGGNPEEWWHYEIEQVPETWEELKEMCKKINSKIVNENAMYESPIIIDTDKGYFGFYYYSTRRIDIVFKSAYSTNHTVAKRRTIPQTWAFIKSLIGEEK